MKSLSMILLLVVVTNAAGTADYCAPSMCREGKHVACEHNGKFASTCPKNAVLVNITSELKTLLVNAHNEKRNLLAGGSVANHDPACRMATIKWDDELASLAELNVKQCEMKHDKCRNTAKFKQSGQNLALAGYTGPTDVQVRLKSAVESWFKEHEKCKMDFIKSYPRISPKIGHFTAMMAEKNTHLGCAVAIYKAPGSKFEEQLSACNYASNSMVKQPIYKSCKTPGFCCTTGKNPHYPHLCSPSEKY